MKNYMKPEAEVVYFCAAEAIADEGGQGSTGTTSGVIPRTILEEEDRRP